jgi:hypothetical protein
MAEIIFVLKEKFGDDRIVNYLFDRLIRKESDHVPLVYKSKGVSKLEEQYKVSIAGLSRIQIRKKEALKGKIIIEHGLPESQAIEMIFKSNGKDEIETVLEELKKNLVCITENENKGIGNGKRRKEPFGFYWEETYKKCGIDVVENPPPVPDERLSKEQAIAIVNQKHHQDLNNSNTMFSNIDATGKQWSMLRHNNHFNNDTNMILNDQNNRKLYYFFIKSGEIKTPSKIFIQRKNKHNHSKLYFDVSEENFKERNSKYNFRKYKIDTISY